jgi:hypothetical protein
MIAELNILNGMLPSTAHPVRAPGAAPVSTARPHPGALAARVLFAVSEERRATWCIRARVRLELVVQNLSSRPCTQSVGSSRFRAAASLVRSLIYKGRIFSLEIMRVGGAAAQGPAN